MTIKAKEIWKYIGWEIVITEKHENEYLPEGIYQIVEKEEYGIILAKDTVDYILDEYEDDDEFEVYDLEESKKLRKLIKYQCQKIIQLSQEGWCIEDSTYNISEELEKLRNYTYALKYLKGLE